MHQLVRTSVIALVGLIMLTLVIATPVFAQCGGKPCPSDPPPTAPPPATSLTDFQKDTVEALFLGSGPLATEDQGCIGFKWNGSAWVPVFTGFLRPQAVTLVVGASVAPATRQLLVAAAAQVVTATNGTIAVPVVDSPETAPVAGPGQVTAAMTNPAVYGCGVFGCAKDVFLSPGVVQSSSVFISPLEAPQAYVHDAIGHALLGLCHINPTPIGGPQNSLMSFGSGTTANQLPFGLTALDLVAVQAVYAANLPLGSTRDAFIAAGLVRGTVGGGQCGGKPCP